MREAASQILLDRAREPDGLRRTVVISLSVHVVISLVLLFSPASWLTGEGSDSPDVVMRISLGGPRGPGEGGLTPLGGRPVQAILPLVEARRPQWIQPPTPTPPKMTVPVEEPAPRPESRPTWRLRRMTPGAEPRPVVRNCSTAPRWPTRVCKALVSVSRPGLGWEWCRAERR